MKKLTYSAMALARLRANERQYLSLILGIFLSIFMVSTLVLSVWGIYQAQLQKRYDKVGYLDMVILDNDGIADDTIESLNLFDTIGQVYISGIVTNCNVYMGYYDEIGIFLMNLNPIEGHLPEAPGEIALEKSAMDILDVDWQLGETVAISIVPVDGTEETRNFTVVGFLPERSEYLSIIDRSGLSQFPAIITSADEPEFDVGRLGIHYLMSLAKHVTLDQAISAIWDAFYQKVIETSVINSFFGLSTTGEQIYYSGLGYMLDADEEMFSLMFIACVLAGSLVLSCGIGISGAMEGVLSKRQEEIGVLRALGATRRQIRRMFGRENLILGLFISPLSILMSMGAVWVLSQLLPGSLIYASEPWLIGPIVLFSTIVILISGYLPLERASKLMPMSVIRDTAMLRRSKHIKSRKVFSVTRLIASRQIRFNPTRQIGAALLVAFMLLGSGMLSALVYSYTDISLADQAAFSINRHYAFTSQKGVQLYDIVPLNAQSIRQIKTLDHVESILVSRKMHIIAQLDEVPQYAKLSSGMFEQFGMLDDAMFEEAIEYKGNNRSFFEKDKDQYREEYQHLRETYGFEHEAFQLPIMTVDLTKENIAILKEYLTDGSIDADAINAGMQVLVLAPEVWVKRNTVGDIYTSTSQHPDFDEFIKDGATLAAWNNAFFTGQTLPLTQLYSEGGDFNTEGDDFKTVIRNDTQVQVGGIVDSLGDLPYSSWEHCTIITTEQGLENMGLRMEGLQTVDIYLDGELSIDEETRLERRLTAITRRSEGYSVFNWMENYRQRQQAKQQELMLYISVVTVFFAIAVGMIVSSVTRQLNSEGRTIGMLRAVGADEKTILGSYSGQLSASMIGGVGISLGLLLLYVVGSVIDGMKYQYGYTRKEVLIFLLIGATICAMALLCLVICKVLLRFRIRAIVNKSIIDNIREL